MRSLRCILFGIVISLLASACGPTSFTRTRMVWKPYDARESKQEKDGVIAELQLTEKAPASFFATVQACDQYGRLIVDLNRNPQLEQVSIRRAGQMWQLLALTNQTEHVIRLNQVAIRAFDPGGNQIEPLTMNDLYARLLRDRPCHSSSQAINQFRAIKIFDRNMEIVPGTTSTFWIVFVPPSTDMPGVWKFAIYEVPVTVNEAGHPTRTTRFEMRVVATQFVDTYRQEPFDAPKLIETKAVGGVIDKEITVVPPKSPTPPGRETPPTKPAIGQRSPPAQPLSITRDVISHVQVQLKGLGFDPGSSDGAMGPKTRDALRKFQSARGLQATGELDTGTLDALGVRLEPMLKY